MYLQTTASECGLACIASIAQAHGYEIELSELRTRFDISLRGATFEDLMEIASTLKLSSRPLRLELDELSKLSLPCILHWDLNHFVVLEKITGNRFVVHDPAIGECIFVLGELSKHFTGVALELFPNEEFKRKKSKPQIPWNQFFERIIGWKRSLLQMILLATILEIFTLIAPFFIQWTVDDVIVSGDHDLLTLLGVGFLLLLVLKSITEAAQGLTSVAFSTQLNVQSSSRVMGHLIRLPARYFEMRHQGDIVSRFQALRAIQETVTSAFIESLLDGIFSLMTAVLMLIYSLKLSVVALLAAILYAGLRYVRYGALRNANRDHLILAAKEQSHFLETMRGIQSVKVGGLEQKRHSQWLNLLVKATNREVATKNMAVKFHAANSIFYGIESVCILWWGATLVMDGSLSVGMLMAFLAYKDSFSARTSNFVDKFIDLRMINLQTERLADIVMTPIEKTEGYQPNRIGKYTRSGSGGSIKIQNISFRYGDREPWVLKDLTLNIEPGECVAIIGPSGCGKSTLVKVLLGLVEPTKGKVFVNGVFLKQYGVANWRKSLGVVMQDDQLFSGSLQENIAGFDENIDLEKVYLASQLAAISDDIMNMPMAYHS